MLNGFTHQGIQICLTRRGHPHLLEWLEYQGLIITNVDKEWEELACSSSAGGMGHGKQSVVVQNMQSSHSTQKHTQDWRDDKSTGYSFRRAGFKFQNPHGNS